MIALRPYTMSIAPFRRAAAHPQPRRRGLKVLHILPAFRLELGGPVRAVIDLSEAMARRGHRVDVASADLSDCPDSWRDPRRTDVPRLMKYERGSLPGPLFTPTQLTCFTRLLARYDAVHFHHVWSAPILQMAPAAVRAGTPYIVSTRGMLDEWPMAQKSFKKRLYLALGGRKVLSRAGWVHCTAEREREQTERWIGIGRSTVVPNFMDLTPYAEPPGPELARSTLDIPDDGTPLVVFLSRVVHNKGPDVLLRAAGRLARKGRRFRVVIAGGGEPAYMQQMKALAVAEGLEGRVCFAGMVTGHIKSSLLAAATVLAVPTCQENFGFVFFEALACGTPVLTSELVDLASELRSGGGAEICRLDDEQFAQSLDRFVTDAPWAGSMGAAGRRWAFNFLNREPLVDRYEALYQTAGERPYAQPDPMPYAIVR